MSERSNKITTISEEEFFRLQEQLIDLRNKNYELIEENQRQRNCINSFASKGNETFLFASKLIGRRNDKLENDKYEEEIFTLRKKLSLQEEEFRLQQTTLLSELNKVMKRCEMLESKLKEFDIADENTVAEMNREIADLKAMIAEKDMLIEEIALLKKDLLHSKSVQDDKIIQLEQSLSNTQNLLINERNLNQILNEKVVSISEEINNLRRISEKSEISEQNGDIEMRFDRKDQSSQSEEIFGTREEARLMEEELQKVHDKFEFMERLFEERLNQSQNAIDEEKTTNNMLRIKLHNIEEALQMEKNDRNNDLYQWNMEKNQLMSYKEEKENELRSLQIEIAAATSEVSNFKNVIDGLNSVKISMSAEMEQKLKAKDEEMKLALKKQSSMVKELRRHVQQEKKRAELAERQVNDMLASMGGSDNFRHRFGHLTSAVSDHCRLKKRFDPETNSSVNSWAYVADVDKNSILTGDGEESSCSISVLESDNAELISRLTSLQKKHEEIVDHLKILEEENRLLRKEVEEKSEIIGEWIRGGPAGGQSAQHSSSISLRRVFDMVKLDDSSADIRDMNRRLQRMLEETLSKNILLQKMLLEQTDAKSTL